MPQPVKRRGYDASRRRELAGQSRNRVLEVARRQFLAHGYTATTLRRIASEADVSVQTVNKQFGSKAGLLRALFDVALVGDDEPTPLAQRTWILAILQAPDPRKKLAMYADVLATVLPRTAPIQLLMRAESDLPEIGTVWEQIRSGRLAGMTDFATNLAEGEHLREGISVERARDVLWTYSSPDLYELLVMSRGWTTTEYASFITTCSVAMLLRT
jgi:AcrR family transcriptional regulator